MKQLFISGGAEGFDFVCDSIAADKSISHRSAMFSLLSDKPSRIRNYLLAGDTLSTLAIIEALGAKVQRRGSDVTITPQDDIYEAGDVLDCGNSGTAIRLFCGLLSSVKGHFVLTGDKYLRQRPMKRVARPLRSIGARIDGRKEGTLAPLSIRGGGLKPFTYRSEIASAQVKSAMILAALRAEGKCYYSEPHQSRDHTERMLSGMGAKLQTGETIEITPMKNPLNPLDIDIPADPSSGFFFAVAAAIVPGGKTLIKNVSLNKTRIESYKVLEKMGAEITYDLKQDRYEPVGDISVSYAGRLQAVDVRENISWLIDELPALAIAMAVARGQSSVANAQELRVKESDRISSVISNLQRCGIQCEEKQDGYAITGGKLQSARIESYGDHRVAMSFAVAGLLADMQIQDTGCIDTSFPGFAKLLSQITKVEHSDD